MALKRVVFYLLILLFLPGCMLQVTYNNLSWIVPWYASDYIDLDYVQEKQFDRELAEVLAWHRESQIPAYVAWLQKVRKVAVDSRPVSYSVVESYANDIQQFYQTLNNRLVFHVIKLFSLLQPQQFEQLFSALEKGNLKYRRENDLSPESRRLKRVEKITERLENWIDDLNDQQIALINRWSIQQLSTEAEALNQQERWQAHLKSLTKTPGSQQAKKGMHRLMTQPSRIWPAKYAQKKQFNQQATIQLITDIVNTLSTEQRQFLIGKLDKYSVELWSIHLQKEEAPPMIDSL